MKATIRQVDSVTVVDVNGRITLGEGCTQLRELIRDQLSKGNKYILLNLAEVTYIDSSGIGELVSAFTGVAKQGGALKLLNLTKKVHDLLQITKLVHRVRRPRRRSQGDRQFCQSNRLGKRSPACEPARQAQLPSTAAGGRSASRFPPGRGQSFLANPSRYHRLAG